jgi:hypothetical protein
MVYLNTLIGIKIKTLAIQEVITYE